MTNEYLRVTQVLSPFSGINKIPLDILNRASERGSAVHQYCDALITGMGVTELPERWMGYVQSFQSWYEGKNFLPKPDRMYCDKLGITGEIDGLYEKDGVISLFDLKTPLKEGNTWRLQGAAYMYLCRNSGIKVDQIEFVKLDKHGEPAIEFIYEFENSFSEFLNCLDMFKKYFSKDKEVDYLNYI